MQARVQTKVRKAQRTRATDHDTYIRLEDHTWLCLWACACLALRLVGLATSYARGSNPICSRGNVCKSSNVHVDSTFR